MRLAAALAVLTLCACAPEPAPRPVPMALDCAQGFATLTARVAADPAIRQAPKEPNEPYRFYNAVGGKAAYMVTEAGAPGHPAILMQEAVREGGRLTMKNTGCAYGDQAGYRQLEAYLESLHAGR